MAGTYVGCSQCGHEETHDPICELHHCEDCGTFGEHHCVVACDVIDCPACFPEQEKP